MRPEPYHYRIRAFQEVKLLLNNIASLLSQTAKALPDKTFLIAGEERLTFAEVDTQATKVACAMAHLGIKPGQVVALLLPNVPLFPICYYAALSLGLVVAAFTRSIDRPRDRVCLAGREGSGPAQH